MITYEARLVVKKVHQVFIKAKNKQEAQKILSDENAKKLSRCSDVEITYGDVKVSAKDYDTLLNKKPSKKAKKK